MKRILVLAAVILMVLPVSAMAGMTAFMDMDELSDTDMAQTTGQAGITINATAQILGGYIAWGDNDGCSAGGTSGWLTLNGITASGLVLDGTTIDVCTEGANTTWLTIGVPALTVTARIDNIELGAAPATSGVTRSILGHLVVGGLQLNNMTLQITGH